MLKEMFQYVVGLKAPDIKELGGVTYSDKPLHEIHAAEHYPTRLSVSTLGAIVSYIKENPDDVRNQPYIIHVENYNQVSLLLPLSERTKERAIHMTATNKTEQFSFGQQMDREIFNIALQSQFVRDQNCSALLQYIGTMQEEEGYTTKDDGVSQSIIAKTGIATLENVTIPNPLELRPFRTFPEVEQPDSIFVFRLHTGMQCAIYEADGGAWKSQCIESIKVWFERELESHILCGDVVILA
jgi:hypothetical protein